MTHRIETMPGEAFHLKLLDNGLSARDFAWIANVAEMTVHKWTNDQARGPNPVAVRILQWIAHGDLGPIDEIAGPTPGIDVWESGTPADVMTNLQFTAARLRLGLSDGELAEILNVDPEVIRKWEGDSTKAISGFASQVMTWMEEGFRPPEFPKAPQEA